MQLPDERQRKGRDGDLSEFHAEIERDEGRSNAASIGSNPEFSQHRGETESVNQPEGKG